MHFHLPRPLHGWREFAGEVGIIVVGVLIALGAEQVVETLHWRHELEAERSSLLQEAKDSFTGVAARKHQQPCVDRRLDEIHTVLERHHHGEPLDVVGEIGRPTRQGATRGTWQIALAGQGLAHMRNDEKLTFSDVFSSFDLFDKAEEKEGEAWLRLSSLNTSDLLTAQDWSGILAAYNAAVDENEHLRALAPWMLDKSLPGVEKYRETGNLAQFRGIVGQICKPLLGARPAA